MKTSVASSLSEMKNTIKALHKVATDDFELEEVKQEAKELKDKLQHSKALKEQELEQIKREKNEGIDQILAAFKEYVESSNKKPEEAATEFIAMVKTQSNADVIPEAQIYTGDYVLPEATKFLAMLDDEPLESVSEVTFLKTPILRF